jgi:hypothetical protein
VWSINFSSRMIVCAILCASVLLLSSSAPAGLIGTYQSPKYTFEFNDFFSPPSISGLLTYGEPNQTSPPANSHILPTDTATFVNNLKFSSSSAENHFVDGKLVSVITAKPGMSIDKVSLEEGGAWYLDSLLGNGNAAASVTLNGVRLDVLEIEGVGNVSGIFTGGTMRFDLPAPAEDNTRTFVLHDAANPQRKVSTGNWHGQMNINVDDALANTPYQGERVTKVSLVFDNILSTQSEAGAHAYIDKKFVYVTPGGNLIPEPASLLMLSIAAVIGLGARLRRKSRQL